MAAVGEEPVAKSGAGVLPAARNVLAHAGALARLELELAGLELRQKLGSLGLAEHDLVGAASRHRPSISPWLAWLLQARWDF